MIASISNYISLFNDNFSIKIDSDRYSLDSEFSKYLKHTMIPFINAVNIIGLYSNQIELKEKIFKEFANIINCTHDFIPNLINKTIPKEFILMITEK
jgi:hypothetical protein